MTPAYMSTADNGVHADGHKIAPIEGTQMTRRWMESRSTSLISRANRSNHHSAFSSLNSFFHICLPRSPFPFVSLPTSPASPCPQFDTCLPAGVVVPSPSTTQRGCAFMLFRARSAARVPCAASLADPLLGRLSAFTCCSGVSMVTTLRYSWVQTDCNFPSVG